MNNRIGLLLPNTTVTVAALFGATMRQRVVAMLNYTAGSLGVQNAMKAASIKTIFYLTPIFRERKFITYSRTDSGCKNWVLSLKISKIALLLEKINAGLHSTYSLPHKAMLAQKSTDAAVILFYFWI